MTSPMSVPRLYVITGCPPGCHSVAGILLRDVTAGYPRDRIAFGVVGPVAGTEPNLSCVPWFQKDVIPFPAQPRVPRTRGILGRAMRQCRWRRVLARVRSETVSRLRSAIEAFGPDLVLAVLDHRLLFAALPVLLRSRHMTALSWVMDPPEWLVSQVSPDRLTRRALLDGFDVCMRSAARVAVISEQMQQAYEARYGIKGIVVRQGFDRSLWVESRPSRADEHNLTIGVAGKLYCHDAWQALLGALDEQGWVIGGRRVRLLILGGAMPERVSPAATYVLMGWRPQAETIRLLSTCDLLYLPYWFDRSYETVVRLSFPGKMSAYAAALVPVFVHGPAYSSAFQYVREHGIGAACDSLASRDIIRTLEYLMRDDTRHEVEKRVKAVREGDLGAHVMRRAFMRLLDLPPHAFGSGEEEVCTCQNR